LKERDFRSRAIVAVVVAAVASSLLGLVLLIVAGQFAPAGSNEWMTKPGDIAAVAAIALIWAPAFALIPSALLGYIVERPKARWILATDGHIAVHLALSVLGAMALAVLFRIVLHLIDPKYPLLDLFGLGLFVIIGVGSGLAWWFLVIVPGKRS
jgi:hypothetical protein